MAVQAMKRYYRTGIHVDLPNEKISSEKGKTMYTEDSQGSFGGNVGNGQTLKG